MDTTETGGRSNVGPTAPRARAGLSVLFAAEGELEGAWIPVGRAGESVVFGRGERTPDDPHRRTFATKQRPGENEPPTLCTDRILSQVQLAITAQRGGLVLRNMGKRELLDSQGREHGELTLAVGDVAELRGRLLLRVTERAEVLPRMRSLPSSFHRFGTADAAGIVGETESAWRLRDAIAFVAQRSAHVLLYGETGTGKEIVANAIHRQSSRKNRVMVSRNAATLPEGLIDAELFGHVAHYPNAGMPARAGLVAEANGSTLFLDEIGELPEGLAAKLLRVLDERGEYQQLGDPRVRQSSFRLLAATNRPLSSLKHDLLARCRLRIELAPLRERVEDIPLLARSLLQRIAREDPAIGERFFEGWDGKSGRARIHLQLMKRLLEHSFAANVRELELLLWTSLGASPGAELVLGREVEAMLSEPRARVAVDPTTLDREQVHAALERANGVSEKAWRDLGLANRFVLHRLMKKFAL